MNRAERRKYERAGKRIIKKVPQAAELARQDAIRSMCKGEYNTPYFKALANVYIDFQEGKITKQRYEELTAKITLGEEDDDAL